MNKELLKTLKYHSEVKECFFHRKEECRGKIKNAHSISKAGRLELIKGLVNKNERVFSLCEIYRENGTTKKGIKDIGWSQVASTFFGFCDYHDTELFKAIENNQDFDKSPEHCFLHSYRAFAFSYHEMKKSYKLVEHLANSDELAQLQNSVLDIHKKLSAIKEVINKLPDNYVIPDQFMTDGWAKIIDKIRILKNDIGDKQGGRIQENFYHLYKNIRTKNDMMAAIDDFPALSEKLSETVLKLKKAQNPNAPTWLKWMSRYKERLDTAIENGSYDTLNYYCRVKPGLFPFACTFAFSPPFLYSEIDNFIILPDDPEELPNSCLMVTVLPDKSNKTIILFSCFNQDKQSNFFLKKLFSLEGTEFERAVTSIIIYKGSNGFMSPGMWEKLGAKQIVLERELNQERSFDKLPEKPFVSQLNFFDNEFLQAATLSTRPSNSTNNNC